MNLPVPHWLAMPGLHLQRPLWLLALLALPLLWWLWRRRRQQGWRGVVDPHLLPHLLEPARGRAGLRLAGVSLAWTLAVLALAGPGWRQQAQPQWESRAPLVIAFDLSSSILAPDLAPTRLAQARAKIETLLRERQGGEVGLVAWAEDAYTVAPLTADAGNIALFLDALAPEVMPVDGHRPERAITHAATLLHQAGFERGDILLLAAQADADALQVAPAVAAQGYRISVLGLGSAAGAPYADRGGAILRTHRDEASLRALAAAGGGRYAALSVDDADLRALAVLDPAAESARERDSGPRIWLDQGYWLLLPLLLLAALAFRRGAGVLAAVPLAVALVLPAPVRAAGTDTTTDGGWWRRADQQAQQRIERGVDAYRQGDFAAAEQAFADAGAGGAQAHYNLGNALARQGKYDEAIAAYDRALQQAPGLEDAIANRKVVEAARKQKPPQDGQGQQGQQGQQGANDRGRNGEPGQQDQGAPSSQADRAPSAADGEDPGASSKADGSPPPQAEDEQARQRQAQADREQRERMQRALEQGQGSGQGSGQEPGQAQAATAAEDAQAREQRQAREAWLRRVPDDPGGLLRAKFRLEYERRQREGQ